MSLENQTTDLPLVEKIKDTLRADIEERFKKVYEDKLMILCTGLDPCWKKFSFLQRYLYKNYGATLSILSKLQAFEAKQTAYQYLNEKFSLLLGNNMSGSVSNVQHEKEQKTEFDLFDILITNSNVTLSTTRDSELFLYENELGIYRNSNPLEWRSVNKIKYPILSQITYIYLCISATSVPSERTFSTAGLLTSDRRLRLTPENADILMFLNKNS
ncbi:unnamed protein product [Rotaria sordida]|uniref:HAT C-terminal dimerisation domain-containing protein n=1 Tax=Rotaria sordida TaxID=392033 RepID=A0A815T3W7_9BILA|nr:unnamed protein product [Rotaria sordida]CAF4178145.1 unnamed protein product [Rotaria sordida]